MKHTMKLLSMILVLAMLLTMTVMAVEPEAETCEEGCVHAHEEDAAALAALEWECSSHNIRIYSERRILSVTSTQHQTCIVAIEECTNSGCSYKMEYPGSAEWEDHVNTLPGNTCSVCFHVSSRRVSAP